MAKKQTFAQLYKEKFNREYGTGEIKYFTPQIKRAIELIPNDILEDGELARAMQHKFANLGFTTSTSSGIAFIGKKQVIKVSFLRDGIASLPARFRVPTEVVKKNQLRLSYFDSAKSADF